jgi:hypothetical protein
MKFSRIAAAAVVAFCASQANAVPTLTVAAAPTTAYAALSFSSGASVQTASSANQWLKPSEILFGSFSVVSTGANGTLGPIATLALGSATSFSFLWGSPDVENTISFGGTTFTGNSVFAGANGSNVNTRLVTISNDGAALGNVAFQTSKIAFEVAQVTPVPEPETYALMLAGLGAIGFVARRRKSV